ncbi:MAG: outer-membrane lipoprotein carrier protein LolA, partial [Caulobacteraceae bacterium]
TLHSYPLGLTPLALFLARDIRLDRGVKVTAVGRFPGGFSIAARDARKKNQGQIVLYFSDPPLALTGWTLTDAQGRAVRVRLIGLHPSPRREGAFFELYRPAPRG